MEAETQPKVQVRIHLNPNGITTPLQRILRESFNNVAVGLQAVAQYQTELDLNLPTSFVQFRIGDQGEKLTKDQLEDLKGNFRTWLLTRAFEDFIKAVFAALQEAYLYCEVMAGPPITLTSQDKVKAWLETMKADALKFNLPTLMNRVSSRLKSSLDVRDHILSINKVRNCLEHRHGIIRQKDINDSAKNALVMKWRRMKVFYEKDGKEIEVRLGAEIQGPAKVMFRFEDTTKFFKLGERIQLSVDEFNEVMLTCSLLGQEIVSKLPTLPNVSRDA